MSLITAHTHVGLEHVPIYNQWMKDPYLLEMTASEPLSLEEEYQMQQNWLNDANKCIFIILAKDKCRLGLDVDIDMDEERTDFIENNLHAMIGDVNLFTSPMEDDENQIEAELDIMIAPKDARRKGYASEAVRLILSFGVDELGIHRYFVKIHENNVESLNFFRERLGFIECNYVACFGEYELEWML